MIDATLHEIRDRLVDAALELAGERGWKTMSLRVVAERADVALADLPADLTSVLDLFMDYGRRVDRRTLAAIADLSISEPERDRLFECVMARFDAMTPHRDAMARAYREFRRDPAALRIGTDLARSMRRSLEAGGFPTGGVRGALLVQAATAAFVQALPIWLGDDEGLSKTMAALDASLRRLFKPRRARLLGLKAT